MTKRLYSKALAMVIVMFCLCGILLVISSGALASESKGDSCKYCGMNKSKFGHTWMIITYDDGSVEEVCSIHCGAMELALSLDKTPVKITVGDYDTKDQIDAENAYWVIGGNKMGVMTSRAKWAFKTKDEQDQFISKFGGKPATFDDAMKAAFEDMYSDTQMIRKKRKMKRMKKDS